MPVWDYTPIKTHHTVPFPSLLSHYLFHFFCHLKKLLRVEPGQCHPAHDKICSSSPELSENWGSSQLAGCSFSTTWTGGGDRHQSMTGGSTSAEHGIRQRSHACSFKHQMTPWLPVWLSDYWNKGPQTIVGNLNGRRKRHQPGWNLSPRKNLLDHLTGWDWHPDNDGSVLGGAMHWGELFRWSYLWSILKF